MFDVRSRAVSHTIAIACCAIDLLAGLPAWAATSRATSPATSRANPPSPPARSVQSARVPALGDRDLGPAVRDLSVLVVGDSWGAALSLGMEAVARQHEDRKVTVIKAARGGCGIVQPTRIAVAGGLVPRLQCNKWPELWRGLVDRFHPDAVLLETGYFDANIRQVLPGRDHAASIADPGFRARFDRQIDRAIRVLSAGGARVFLTTVSSPPKPFWNRVNGGWAAAMNDALLAAARRNPAVRVLDLRGQMCTAPDRDCPTRISGISVYDQTLHPSKIARQRLGAWILDSIYADLRSRAPRPLGAGPAA